MEGSVLQARPSEQLLKTADGPVGGPVSVAWREGTLTRAKELESLSAWVLAGHPRENCDALVTAISRHLEAAREATKPNGLRRLVHNGALIERAMSNLDAAEAQLLNLAPPAYVLGQLPSLLKHVQCHLVSTDPRRQEFERIARKLGVKDPDHPLLQGSEEPLADKCSKVEEERGKIVTTVRGASSAALREQLRVRSFRNILVATIIVMTVLAILVAFAGYFKPTLIPLCFAPEEGGRTTVVCPTQQSPSFPSVQPADADAAQLPAAPAEDVDDFIKANVTPWDLLIVELVGLTAAAVAAAAAIRGIRGSSERYGLPVALAALKLPTGAITAFLGLMLMRGQFVPGLTALDTSAQILAWALIFGYAQQLFTRFVDRQGQTVLDSVRNADGSQPYPAPP